MKRLFIVLLVTLIIIQFIGVLSLTRVSAQSRIYAAEHNEPPDIEVISSKCSITLNGSKISTKLTDNSESTYLTYKTAEIAVISPVPIGGVYIKFDRTPPLWSMSGPGFETECGTYGFLHEYQAVSGDNVNELYLEFKDEVSIADIFVLSDGDTLPSFVQVWRPAEGVCDIMLLSCHSDDDQLFFAGSVPDAVARGAEMQVCYFTNHWNTHTRPHELLNGLWTCGLDRYPVIGDLPDTVKTLSESAGLKVFADLGFTYDDMVGSQVELLRKYKPQIVLVHDINGEYGHGAHRLDSHSLRDAALVSNDPNEYKESAANYGVWDVPKIYIHLYKENTIDFEIDSPLAYFGGRTAYQVSQDAFKCHISQYKSRYKTWLLGTDEDPVTNSYGFPDYSPRYYGLWRSLVGEDVEKTDFYENILLYSSNQSAPKPELFEQPAVTTVTDATGLVTSADPVTNKPVSSGITVVGSGNTPISEPYIDTEPTFSIADTYKDPSVSDTSGDKIITEPITTELIDVLVPHETDGKSNVAIIVTVITVSTVIAASVILVIIIRSKQSR